VSLITQRQKTVEELKTIRALANGMLKQIEAPAKRRKGDTGNKA
jgi:hypothetical protein